MNTTNTSPEFEAARARIRQKRAELHGVSLDETITVNKLDFLDMQINADLYAEVCSAAPDHFGMDAWQAFLEKTEPSAA